MTNDPVISFRSIRRLAAISATVRAISQAIFLLTVVGFSLLLYSVYKHTESSLSLYAPLSALVAIGAYDSVRRKGDVLFEELSDELQWHVQHFINEPGRKTIAETGTRLNRPHVDLRILLRTYARATSLPLLPGRVGAAIYAFVNVMFAVFAVLPWTHS
jgi:hypothetical protein